MLGRTVWCKIRGTGGLIKVHDPDVDRNMYMYKDEINVRKEVDYPIRKKQGEKLRPIPKKQKVK